MTTINYTLVGDMIENLAAAPGTAGLKLVGNALANEITGSTGNDTLQGGEGSDRLQGGAGNDTYIIDTQDQVADTSGIDTVVVSFNYRLASSLENLTASGPHGYLLIGNTGNNAINGNTGADTIRGDLGKDTLLGGAGKDIFVFDTRLNPKTNLDKIVDFSVKDDTIWLDNKYFEKLGKGSEAAPGEPNKKFFVVGDKAKDGNDYLIYNKKTGKLLYDGDGSGTKVKAVEIAQLSKNLKMTALDFMII